MFLYNLYQVNVKQNHGYEPAEMKAQYLCAVLSVDGETPLVRFIQGLQEKYPHATFSHCKLASLDLEGKGIVDLINAEKEMDAMGQESILKVLQS